jgi:hypothetical protein
MRADWRRCPAPADIRDGRDCICGCRRDGCLLTSTPGGRSVNFCRSVDADVSVASAAFGARCVSTALAGSAALAESCTALESLPVSDRLLDPPACAPADTMTIAATKIILRI